MDEFTLKKEIADNGVENMVFIFRPVIHQGKTTQPNSSPFWYLLEIERDGIGKGTLQNTRRGDRLWRNLSAAVAYVSDLSPQIVEIRVLTPSGAGLGKNDPT